jgi:hypothetical protein
MQASKGLKQHGKPAISTNPPSQLRAEALQGETNLIGLSMYNLRDKL